MTWLEYHKLSEESAQRAEAALRQQNPQQAQTFYAQAAQAELLALADLDPNKFCDIWAKLQPIDRHQTAFGKLIPAVWIHVNIATIRLFTHRTHPQ